jgi:ectoine hydroxylase-related dioxygenase (phytanoyl-CoA dioxygenase family)
MSAILTDAQIAAFRARGCVTVPGAARPGQIAAINADLAAWIAESRAHPGPFGETIDGRARFDVQPGHSAETPALRRVQSPTEVSEACLDVLTGSPMIDMLADLIGPDLRFHHAKINCKLPGSDTVVDWHQDFLFDPHSNDDLVTCLMFLGDVTAENGPLLTVPGSHKGPLRSLWHDGVFTGAVDAETARACDRDAVAHVGPAGSVCFMHCRTLHASRANRSDRPRNLFIAAIAAADAVPLVPNHVPSRHAGMLLRGREPNRIRSTPFEMEPPVLPETTFFDQQAGVG